MTDGAGSGDADRPTIRELDARTVERIAAGEVVERPASVVKELVENSLDAGASRVDVAVEDGGTGGVRVADDGRGMTEADVRVAVRKHTTSKIRDIDDLEAGVATLGFRGEALSTIGAVSRTTITTRAEGGDSGTELRMAGGDVTDVRPAGRAPGTTVDVSDLFYNVPARRKYLKTEATEFAHVNRVVTRYALANPDVAVSLSHDGREVFATDGRGDLRAALLSVYGREVAASMVRIDPDDGAIAESPLSGIRGFVSDPETTRSTREYVSTYVNGRYVSEAAVREAVVAGYGDQLAADRFPFAVVFLDVPPGEVDVNVHPRKMEVRFGDEDGVRDAVEAAVEAALLDHGHLRSGAPRGRSAPDDAPIAPERPDRPDRRHRPDHSDRSDRAEETSTKRNGANRTDAGESAGGRRRSSSGRLRQSATGRPGRAKSRSATDDEDPHGLRRGANSRGGRRQDARQRDGRRRGDEDSASARPEPPADRKFAAPAENARLADDPEREFERLPPMRVLGQVHDTYVAAETPDGLVLVDQHAADERVNYERLAARAAERRDSQALVAPVRLELTAAEAAAFDAALPELRDLGFEARLADDATDAADDADSAPAGRVAVVEAVPAVFADALDPDLLRDVLAEFVADGAEGGDAVDAAADALLADLACYPSITGNTSLAEGSVVDLLARLDACENPYACPHGRPTVVALTSEEIADRFERDYPGHQVREPEA